MVLKNRRPKAPGCGLGAGWRGARGHGAFERAALAGLLREFPVRPDAVDQNTHVRLPPPAKFCFAALKNYAKRLSSAGI